MTCSGYPSGIPHAVWHGAVLVQTQFRRAEAARDARRVNPFYHRIYRIVRHIPKGRVATYGIVARLAGRPGAARTVGWALSALPEDSDVPWWRVINAAGRISLAGEHSAVLQRALLLREGVKFVPGGAVNLGSFGWPAEAYDSVAAAHSRAASSRRSRRLKGFRT